jgi:hypothetical protein
MREIELGTPKRICAVIAFITVTGGAILVSAALLRPASLARSSTLYLTGATRAASLQSNPARNRRTLSTLQPTEMPAGCLNCPISSYFGSR